MKTRFFGLIGTINVASPNILSGLTHVIDLGDLIINDYIEILIPLGMAKAPLCLRPCTPPFRIGCAKARLFGEGAEVNIMRPESSPKDLDITLQFHPLVYHRYCDLLPLRFAG